MLFIIIYYNNNDDGRMMMEDFFLSLFVYALQVCFHYYYGQFSVHLYLPTLHRYSLVRAIDASFIGLINFALF